MEQKNLDGLRPLDSTHWETCWKDPKHHACALRKIKELQDLVESKEEALDLMERGML